MKSARKQRLRAKDIELVESWRIEILWFEDGKRDPKNRNVGINMFDFLVVRGNSTLFIIHQS